VCACVCVCVCVCVHLQELVPPVVQALQLLQGGGDGGGRTFLRSKCLNVTCWSIHHD
jgi:hypothetical protein